MPNLSPWRNPKNKRSVAREHDRVRYVTELETVGKGPRWYHAPFEPLKLQPALPIRPGSRDFQNLPSLSERISS